MQILQEQKSAHRITGLHHYYGLIRPCAAPRYVRASTRPGLRSFSLSIAATGSHVPYKRQVQARATSLPVRHPGSQQASPRLISEHRLDSGFDDITLLSTPQR